MIKKILVVDDSPVARKMLKKCIPKDMDYEIFEAVNGQDGIDKFVEHKPDITFMDLTMPVLDGYQATNEILKIDKTAIIIVTTADVQPKSIETVMNAGAFSLIKKPAKEETILNAIEEVQKNINRFSGDKKK